MYFNLYKYLNLDEDDIKFIEVKTGKSKDVKKMQATLNEEGLLITDPTGEHLEPEKLLFPR